MSLPRGSHLHLWREGKSIQILLTVHVPERDSGFGMSVDGLDPKNVTRHFIYPATESNNGVSPWCIGDAEGLLAQIRLRLEVLSARLVEGLTCACNELNTHDEAAVVDESDLSYIVCNPIHALKIRIKIGSKCSAFSEVVLVFFREVPALWLACKWISTQISGSE